MTPAQRRVSDLTIEEFTALVRTTVRAVLAEERASHAPEPAEYHPQAGILDIPPLQLDPRHPALGMLSREEMYGDDGR